MRSFLLTAAIAASVIATSLTAADAASSYWSRDTQKVKAPVERMVPAGSFAQDVAQDFTPFPPSGFFTNRDPRLSLIESQLGQAERSINAARRHGYMTQSEAQAAREDDRLILNTAMNSIAQNHGSIPDASYDKLLDHVAGLKQTIQLDVANSGRA